VRYDAPVNYTSMEKIYQKFKCNSCPAFLNKNCEIKLLVH
jgi:hypothetical protein